MVVGGRELIDTLWNVNLAIPKSFLSLADGINRYIMECKFLNQFLFSFYSGKELIDTLWNVNEVSKLLERGAILN